VWKNLRDCPEKMVRWIFRKKEKFETKALYQYCKEGLLEVDEFEQGCMYLCLLRMSWCALALRSCYQATKDFSDPQVIHLLDLAHVLRSVDLTITNKDYSECLTSNGEGVAIYADPPYRIDRPIYGGANGELHRKFNHSRFGFEMRNCPHKWIVTYNDDDEGENRSKFADFNFEPLFVSYGMRNYRKMELLISNY
jgi:DNA adenine methylase